MNALAASVATKLEPCVQLPIHASKKSPVSRSVDAEGYDVAHPVDGCFFR